MLMIAPDDRQPGAIKLNVRIDTSSNSKDGTIQFLHHESSDIRKLGLREMYLSVPQGGAARRATHVRDILQAGAHFFKYLTCEPQTGRRVFREGAVQADLYELVESKDWVLSRGRAVRQMCATKRLKMDPTLKAYKVEASKRIGRDEESTQYGVQITNNKLEDGLFVWMFFFDCSTFEIRTCAEPRIASAESRADTLVPGHKNNSAPQPVPVNFGNSGYPPLQLGLYNGQKLDVGYLRIFMSTRYADLSSCIAQGSMIEEDEEDTGTPINPVPAEGGKARGLQGITGKAHLEDLSGFWHVITLPLVQEVAKE
ncbi:hypothetical protein K488DRAFT_92434 [Vararia minispora EC-137]|uniref:Uncharacterized protein n=1 Tax=Vararia minispora EC-137 TaxID=1314806 RepID=A0ACB8Q446_9AGAM|nr:hypothetical protein K488DRAFT_92434 [Vararia minispora EC-137]